MSLLPVAEAQARLLALAPDIACETVPLDDCAGRWLAEDVLARRDQPWADLSAMDGYAIAHADLPGPWRVIGDSTAGDAFPAAVGRGEAARIFTGAPLPPGTDTILIQEDVARDGDTIRRTDPSPLPAATHVRARGSDFAAQHCLLTSGCFLGPAQVALAALGGYGALPVRRKLRVALISTGNELVPPSAEAAPGKLPSSNAVMLRAMLRPLPVEVLDLGIVRDELAPLQAVFEQARGADIVVTTGGASVGDHDLVKPALEAAGGTLDFWKIRMRPGKPLIAGALGDAIFLGLPGNPVSAFVTATLFLLPLARHMAGCLQPLPELSQGRLASPIKATGPREEYLRARLSSEGAVVLTAQDSAATRALAEANCLVRRPADAPAARAGDSVDILPLG